MRVKESKNDTVRWYYTDDNRIAQTGGTQCLVEGTNGIQTYQCSPGNNNQGILTPLVAPIHPPASLHPTLPCIAFVLTDSLLHPRRHTPSLINLVRAASSCLLVIHTASYRQQLHRSHSLHQSLPHDRFAGICQRRRSLALYLICHR